jgi:dolichol-phosphate mannosyltransferase
MRDNLSVVISAYNEEGNVSEIYRRVKNALGESGLDSAEIVFVDDGSSDSTFLLCRELQEEDPAVKIVRLTRNVGHEIAMRAGLDNAAGDAVLFMDADLQHPPELIPNMVRLWKDGYDIVLTRRTDNKEETYFHGVCSRLFYKALNFMSDVEIPQSMPDFRLIDRKYADWLKGFNERDALFRGTLSMVAALNRDNVATLDFVADKRNAGESKYSFWNYLHLALSGILQFSVRPLHFSLWLSVISGLLACGLGLYVIVEYFVLKHPTPGYATIMTTVVFMGSMNLFVLAIVGTYIGKIHQEAKKRPLYFADVFPGERRHECDGKDNQR